MNTLGNDLIQIAPPGSDLYYATRFLANHQRLALLTLYAFEKTLYDIPEKCSDPGLARVKIHWWQQEVEKLFAGQAEHPLTKALTPIVQNHKLSKTLFNDMLTGVLTRLDTFHWQNEAEQRHYCYQIKGASTMLASTILGNRNEKTSEFARHMGLFLGLTQCIFQLRHDIHNDCITLCADEMQTAKLNLQSVWEFKQSEELASVLSKTTERAQQYYQLALANLLKADRHSQRPLVCLGKLSMSLLDEIKTEGFQVLKHQVMLTPIRKLFLTCMTQLQYFISR